MSLDVDLRCKTCKSNLYSSNITHNLGEMATAAGIYDALWRPDKVGIKTASELIPVLVEGTKKLIDDPEKFKAFNPPNGWGEYENLVEFVMGYLKACREYPDAEVLVSR